MQTTLLGIAIAFILALVAALAGPFLIDWERFRPTIEAEASRLAGVPVRVTGPINAVLLPTPSLTLRGIEVGPPDSPSHLRARSLAIEFSLGSLMRGKWRAGEMHLAGPDFQLGLTPSGHLALPRLATSFEPETFSIERLNVEDGHATLTDARNGSRLVLEKLWFNGDVRSLAGPFKGDGAFVIAGELYAYRIATGRTGDDGATKLRFNIDPVNRPLAIDADGTLSFEHGAPRFEGALNLTRPAGIALADGQTLTSEPWRLASRVKATAASALLEEIEFQYGPEERAAKLTGTAEIQFGGKPRFDGVLSARQVDLDRAFATPNATRLLPFAAVKSLSNSFSGVFRPGMPARLGVSIDLLTLAGATVHTLRGDVTADGDGWNLEGVEFNAPGFTQVALSGRLDVAGQRLGFVGPVSVDSSDPSGLVAWLEGTTYSAVNRMKPLRGRGEITLGAEKIAIERFRAEIDRKVVEGRLAYAWASADHSARLDANLTAAELDVDALLALANSAQAGMAFQTPREVTLGLAIGRATVAGIEARQIDAQISRDAKGLRVGRFSIADFGGAGFEASGHIDTHLPSPQGTMNVRLDARSLSGVATFADKFAPAAAVSVRRVAELLPGMRLNANLTLEDAGAATVAKLAIEGQSGAIRLSLLGEARRNAAEIAAGDLQALAAADVRLQGKFEADNGTAIIDLLSLGKIVTADASKPGQLDIVANGPLGGDLQVDGRLLAGGLDASSKGTLRLGEPKADLRLTVAAADARPLRRSSRPETGDPLPVTLDGNLTITGQSLALRDFSGLVAGSSVRGAINVALAEPMRIDGRLEADNLDVPAAVAAAAGMPATPRSATWSTEPFGQGLFEGVNGRIEFKAARASFTPTVVLRQAQGVASFNRSEISFTDVQGTMADGRATGQLTFSKYDEGLSARARFHLNDADAAVLLPAGIGASIVGRLALQIDLEGAGLSPMAVMGSLTGNGMVSLARAQLAGLDAKAFDVATEAVNHGAALDAAKIGEIVVGALSAGRLAVTSAEGVITVTGGQMRLTNTVTQADGADLTMSGNIDLIEGDLNARLALSARGEASSAVAERPVVFVSLKGPVGSPKRTVDVGALTAWLTLRAVDLQSKRLEALEEKAQPRRPAEDSRASSPVPESDQAPPLPPPVEIHATPRISDQQPTAASAQAPAQPARISRPSQAKPAPPPIRLTPQDLSASRDD